MSEWKPIETAPRDGSSVLLLSDYVFVEDGPNAIWMGYWPVNDKKQWCFLSSWDCEPLTEATHWMPLPEPPSDG